MLTERAWQMLRIVQRWLPERPIVAVADSGFAALELLASVSRLQRQWSRRAIARTIPLLRELFSIVTLITDRLITGQAMAVRTSA